MREWIERELGLPAEHVVVTATRAHKALRTADVSPGALAHAGSQRSRQVPDGFTEL
ncbi:hypothetical protein [Streptomyces sp. NBC_01643]|uniref:hypothetical protein n=1 Tax=Streptomyces sp. NBC_01643 TaxID=2975906 RepID=UPI0038681378|nr:hypothetical protein OHB03_31145 [Streptomyces sp. NBC_01643]